MTKKEDEAFPVVVNDNTDYFHSGLSKREYFAAMAMQGYISCREFDKYNEELLAMCSVVQADALIKALNEIQP